MSASDPIWRVPAVRLARMSQMLAQGVAQGFTGGLSATVKVLDRNSLRWGFTIGYYTGATVLLWPGADISSSRGWLLNQAYTPISFTVGDHGGWVQNEIYVMGGGQSWGISVVETTVLVGDFDENGRFVQVNSDGGKA